MSEAAPAPEWLSATQIAQLALPGLGTAQAVRRWVERNGLAAGAEARSYVRCNAEGELECHVAVLPRAARLVICPPPTEPDTQAPTAANDDVSSAAAWAEFHGMPARLQAEARRRLETIQTIDALVAAGMAKSKAVADQALARRASERAIYDWYRLIRTVEPANWLPALAPRRRGSGTVAEIDDTLWQELKSDYLRNSKPSFETCYRRVERSAKARGLTLPHRRTLWRRLQREVPPQVMKLRREGVDALRRQMPPQERTVTDLHAMELVNIDGHIWDVRVEWPDGTIGRPTMIAIQDVYSRKMLAWRIAPTEDTITAQLCFADLFRDWGIPTGVLADNGRAFASKWLTGGVPTRFRFLVKPDEPKGLLPSLGVKVHWALPFRGSSKPIERGFRDFCDAIAKHPAFEGAYTGNSPTNKPANYGSRAVPIDRFKAIVTREIAEHNARMGRRSEIAAGVESFDQVFARSYATAPITKATSEQLRFALYLPVEVTADRGSGVVRVLGNRYWTDELNHVAGKKVIVRFDPEDATKPVLVSDKAGRYVVVAPPLELSGFLDAEAAKRHARLEADFKKKTRAAEAAQELLTAQQLAARYAALAPDYFDGAEKPEARVVRPARIRTGTSAALKADLSAPEAAVDPDFSDLFAAGIRRLRVVD